MTITNSGTAEASIVFESAKRWGAIMNKNVSNLIRYASGNSTRYITIRGIWFRDTPLDDDGPEANAAVLAAKGWRIEDCRFTKCGVGIILNRKGKGVDVDDTAILRCVFENMKVNSVWSWGTSEKSMKNHVIRDTVIRRCNTLNHDMGWHAGALKYMFTDNMLIDGIISYDNNGAGFWLDWDNAGFTVQNCTFFGNHAGECHKNYGDSSFHDAWWSGMGFMNEGNPSGTFINNTFYSNLACGLGICESGFNGGNTVLNNIFADNHNCIQFRAMDRGGHVLGSASIKNNRFKGWRDKCWNTSMEETVSSETPDDHGIILDKNTYDSKTGKFGKWKNKTADSVAELQSILHCEENGKAESVSFEGPLHEVCKTTLADVGNESMWQIPSRHAEKNCIEKALNEYCPGQLVSIPVTGRKEIIQDGSGWTTEVYDLQACYVKLFMNETQKEWVESNIKTYASTSQINIEIKLTRKEPYTVEAILANI